MVKKAEFLSEFEIKSISDDLSKLIVPLKFASKYLKRVIEVPAGFVTDGASVPRLPFVYLAVGGKSRRPACIHDWLYQTHGTRSKRQADLVFLEAMKVDGISLWARTAMYWGVRIGGFSSWNSGPSRYAELQRLLK